MRKLVVSLLSFAAFAILVYNITLPSHLTGHLEMQHCGGCHSEESTIRMHYYADPLEKECIECHTTAMTGLGVHAEMIPGECDRCHEFGHRPAYADCNLCHGSHYHIEGGIDTGNIPCATCHESHSLLTDRGCAKCHREEYNLLKTQGDKHSERPDSCYTCHLEHQYIPHCLDCHERGFHGEDIVSNCTHCHQQHMPKALFFSTEVTRDECGVCHQDVIQYFRQHPTRHTTVNCADCHQKHQRWSECIDCHADAHPEYAEYNVDKCMGCHRDAHSPARYGFEKGWKE